MNELQHAAFAYPAAHSGHVGREHFRTLPQSPYGASVGLSINR